MSVLVRLPVDFLLLKMVYVQIPVHHQLNAELMRVVKPLKISRPVARRMAMLNLPKHVHTLVTVSVILYAYLHQGVTVPLPVVNLPLIVQEIVFAKHCKGFQPA